MFYLFAAVYGTVLFAELLGDKSLYMISSLTARFRLAHIFAGLSLAFAGKMLVAVLVGQTIATLPLKLVAGISAATFFLTALALWFKKTEASRTEHEPSPDWTRATAVSFAAVFFTEWGDIGQITAATLVARYQAPLVIWLGATIALVTKGLLAITLGVGLRKHISPRWLRYGAVVMCLTMGVLAAFGVD
ncbi:MAG TPA: TMEM165/GDT1 family protein [Pyrinomonadaceae bacterium]